MIHYHHRVSSSVSRHPKRPPAVSTARFALCVALKFRIL